MVGLDTAPDDKLWFSYNHIHILCQNAAPKILSEFDPDLMIAIGGGGFIPARILRTFLKRPGSKNIPIQAIGLSLYEDLPATEGPNAAPEQPGTEVIRTQWLDFSTLGAQKLLGKNILIVDEIDDTRTTLHYAITELKKDIEKQLQQNPAAATKPTNFAVFVVHNKVKQKNAVLPQDVKYFAAQEIPDRWSEYPWEQKDINEATSKADALASASALTN